MSAWLPDLGAVLLGPVAQKAHLAACVVTGGVMCFFGYRLFRVALGLFGALVGGYVAGAVGLHLSDGAETVALFCAVTGGVLGAVLMVAVYLLGVFVAGATLGGILAGVFTLHAGPDTRAVAMAAVAAIGGFLALFVQRFVVTAATALNGSALVVGGLWLLYARLGPLAAYHGLSAARATSPIPGVHKYVLVGAWAALGCFGAWAQFSAPRAPAAGRREKGAAAR